MKRKILGVVAALWLCAIPLQSQSQATCNGAFPNVVSDICWDCMFPLRIAGGLLQFGGVGDDYDSGASTAPVCICAANLTVGSPMSFWEPSYMVDVTNKPGCMPLLGGVDISPPYNASEFGGIKNNNAHVNGKSRSSFMHVNEYINPVMTALGIVTNNPCLDTRGFDVPYLSWADPTWNDDELAMMLTPYAYPFAGVASVAAEMPDAIKATIGFPSASLFWVAGAWGPMYPPTGNVASANTNEQVSHLLIARLFSKLHAAGTKQSTAGQASLESCGAVGIPEFLMDKRQYKTNRLFPFPDNLCTPIGRPLTWQEKGASRPQDKDYGYFIFRKKDCCLVQ